MHGCHLCNDITHCHPPSAIAIARCHAVASGIDVRHECLSLIILVLVMSCRRRRQTCIRHANESDFSHFSYNYKLHEWKEILYFFLFDSNWWITAWRPIDHRPSLSKSFIGAKLFSDILFSGLMIEIPKSMSTYTKKNRIMKWSMKIRFSYTKTKKNQPLRAAE